ncbi:MAG TPA: TolC family protein [Spirochaetota bacterium]|nr:TolC family protein [Spirochaetota bacterium]
MRSMYVLGFVMFALLVVSPLYGQEAESPAEKISLREGEGLAGQIKKDEKLKLTLDRVLQYLLMQNLDIKKAFLEYRASDTDLRKYQALYDTYAYGKGGYAVVETPPENPMSTFQGTETTQKNYEVGLSRRFNTGTTLQVNLSGLYQNIKGAGITMPAPIGTINMGGEGYQSAVMVKLSQEILKNSFGQNDRLNERMIANAAEMRRRAVKLYLSNLLVQALVGYWNVAVAEETLGTTRINLESTTNIRNLMGRKLALGLAEREELLDWNGKVLQSKNYFDLTGKAVYDARLAVLRILNLDGKTDFELGQTFSTRPPDIPLDRAMSDALLKRVDLANQRTMVQNAELEYRAAAHNELPSLKLILGAGTVDYNRDSYGKTFNDVNRQYSAGFEVAYPLGNSEADSRMRNARVSYQKAALDLEKLEKEVRDEVDSAVRQCAVLYQVYVQTKEAREYQMNYYNGVLRKFGQGRYSAIQLKLALDGYIQARQAELKSLVDYNVSLLQRDLARNVIFENYGIDLDSVLGRMKNR